MSVMHTGQPGPMMTLRPRGKLERSPYFAIACSWLPHTCITDTVRPIDPTVWYRAAVNSRARVGSRNSRRDVASSVGNSVPPALPALLARTDLCAHVGRHQVFGTAAGVLAQQLLVQRQ